jgi:hypothetical protein
MNIELSLTQAELLEYLLPDPESPLAYHIRDMLKYAEEPSVIISLMPSEIAEVKYTIKDLSEFSSIYPQLS